MLINEFRATSPFYAPDPMVRVPPLHKIRFLAESIIHNRRPRSIQSIHLDIERMTEYLGELFHKATHHVIPGFGNYVKAADDHTVSLDFLSWLFLADQDTRLTFSVQDTWLKVVTTHPWLKDSATSDSDFRRESEEIFYTSLGYVGVAQANTKENDVVALLDRTYRPMILRPHGDSYRFVCYCHLPAINFGLPGKLVPMEFDIR